MANLNRPRNGKADSFSTPAFDLVVMVASTGGIPSLQKVLRGIPAGFPAAIVAVQHRSPGHDDRLPGILAQHTALPIALVEDGESLRAGEVHIAPSASQVLVVDGPRLTLAPAMPSSLPISACWADPLFVSAASHLWERVIGVVLTGRLRDGAEGVRAIKSHGGVVLVEDPRSSQEASQPEAAIGTGCVDFVLPVDKIAPALVCLTMVPGGARFFHVPPPPWADLVRRP